MSVAIGSSRADDRASVHGGPRSQPILVTGAPRSGTTWVGSTIAAAARLRYVHEPFNPHYYRPAICSVKFPTQFQYICAENEGEFLEPLKRTLQHRLNWTHAAQELRSWRDAPRLFRTAGSLALHRSLHSRCLVKDPIAMLSAEWLATRCDMSIVFLVRHPAAFVSSLKRKNSRAPLELLLQQPLLVRDWLGPDISEIETALRSSPTDIERAALFWKVTYGLAARWRQLHPDWLFMRHEDLSRTPVDGFRKLHQALRLPFTRRAVSLIDEFSPSDGPTESPVKASIYKLNSRANIWNWTHRLTTHEIVAVRSIVQDVSSEFYSDADWESDHAEARAA
jgi:hypothetical protein